MKRNVGRIAFLIIALVIAIGVNYWWYGRQMQAQEDAAAIRRMIEN